MKASLKKSEVTKILKQRVVLTTRYFLFKTHPNEEMRVRVGFVFSRKSGRAVTRNRFKRRIRELVRTRLPKGAGIDVLCVAKTSLESLDLSQWQAERQKIITWCESF